MTAKIPSPTPAGDPARKPPHPLPFPIVGIGASAGEIQALVRFFENMPKDTGMAFVVVVHLSSRHESHVDEILQRATRMPTVQVASSLKIEKNHVYVISPASNLEMVDGMLRVVPAERPRERHVVIDVFFRTLADEHTDRAVGIVMSGTGADGSVGIARIKEQGGVGIAQLPEDAEYEDMPRAAIESGAVDFILPVAEMPQKLADLWSNASRISLPPPDQPPTQILQAGAGGVELEAGAALAEILRLLSIRTGHDFMHYKRATVLRRLERRLQVCALSNMHEYLSYLESHPEETKGLLDDMLIGVTNFFRDREAFEALERQVIPELIEDTHTGHSDGIRGWCAGCSTGEEAFSLAMLLSGEAERRKNSGKIQIFATDVDEKAIAVARRAQYSLAIATDVPPVYLRQYFRMETGHYHVAKVVRDRVLFASHNVLQDPPFSRLQLISCRNLMIYLDRRAQQQVLQTFHSALQPGGYLFLGSSETADAAEGLFSPVDKNHRIYRASPAARKIYSSTRLRSPANKPDGIAHPPATVPAQLAVLKPATYAQLHQRALERLGPPTALIDGEGRIVHLSEGVGRYLRYVGGEPSHHLPTLVVPELQLDVRAAVHDALKRDTIAVSRPVRLAEGGRLLEVTITVAPFREHEAAEKLLLVLFQEMAPAPTTVGGSNFATNDAMVHKLSAEVELLRKQLQETIEQSEASTEELKAANEESQAINEELRSATEELETSKEELESINEELITVNYELKLKVEETVKINDDLQNLIASSDIATVFVDGNMLVKWFTPPTVSLFNLILTDRGRPLQDITHRLDYPDMLADAQEAFKNLRVIEREVRTTDNRWFLTKILPYRTVEDRIDGAVLNFVDISERVKAQEALREGLERLRLISEGTRDFAIISMDPQGAVTGWNRAAEIIFGFTAAEMEGHRLDCIFSPEDREKNCPAEELRRAREQGHAEDERWHLRKNGSRFFCSGVVYPLIDGGALRGYAKIARDLTEKHIEDHQRVSTFERSEAANLLKDQFIAIMSHELRHPLNLIQLNTEVLARIPEVGTTPKAASALEKMRKAILNQSQIISDLLDLSRVQTGKLKLDCRPVCLADSISTVLDAVGVQANAAQVSLRAPDMQDETVRDILVQGDPSRIEQIIWNLMNNAIKFTPPGGTVTVSLSREGGEARVDVNDTGIGIEAGSLSKIFTMFRQVDDQHNHQNRHGLGIGLALVAQLAEAHGGRASASSPGEGRGSTFSLWLPLARHDDDTEEGDVHPASGRLEAQRILVVDDSEEIVSTLSTILEMEGAEVTTAHNGKQALAKLEAEDFDILVSDLGMPVMDGYTMLARLRHGSRNADIPAIALTGFGYSEKARLVGFTDQMCKPVPMNDLIIRLVELVSLPRSKTASQAAGRHDASG